MASAFGADIRVDSPANDGPGSLREAIAGAKSGDVIIIRTESEIELNAPINITNHITIAGQNGPLLHTVSGGNSSYLFSIESGAGVTIERLSLRAGFSAGDGGAIFSQGNLALRNVRLYGHSAGGSGGAVYQFGGSLTVDRCYFFDNAAVSGDGGAIAAEGVLALTIVSSGFGGGEGAGPLGNSAGNRGGAVWVASAASAPEPFQIRSSTFVSNSAGDGAAAVFVESGSGRGVNLTLADNLVSGNQLLHISASAAGSFALADSIVERVDASVASLAGSVALVGNNLIGALEDLGVGDLGWHGGLSPTFLIKPGSPAIDGSLSDWLGSDDRDQRGLARFSDGDGSGDDARIADIGAFEIQHYQVSALQLRGSATGGADDEGYGNPFDPSDDAESIASADVFEKLTRTGKADIGDAVGANNAAGGGAISFQDRIVPGRILLKGKELQVRRDVAIYGPGATQMAIDGAGRSPVFRVGEGAEAYISKVAIENGLAQTGAGIIIDESSRVELEEVSLSGNQASSDGGGIAVLSGSTYVFRSALVGNSAGARGGAVFSAAGPSGAPNSVVIDTSTVAGNSAGGQGGAVHAAGDLSLDSVAVVDNTAGQASPGIYIDGGGVGHAANSIFSQEGSASIALASGGSFESGGYNLTDAVDPTLSASSDRQVADLQLSPLSLNGGETLARAPQPSSPAVDTGSSANPPAHDQPGRPREKGLSIDVGPVEFQNDAPEIDCPESVVVDCAGGSGATVSLVVFALDPDGDAVSVSWQVGGAEVASDSVPAGLTEGAMLTQSLDLPVGVTQVTVVASDAYLSTSCAIEVTVQDDVAPVVTLNGSSAIDLECGAIYTEAGATASDGCDGGVVAVLSYTTLPGLEEVALSAGTYTVNYSATDASGNTGYATRTIVVADTTDPLVIPPADVEAETGDSGCATSVSIPQPMIDDCSAIEAVLYSILPNEVYPNGLDAIGASLDFLPGVHEVLVTARDVYGNEGTATFTVTVLDTTAPSIALNGASDVTLECGIEDWIDPSATALDNCSGALPVSKTVYLDGQVVADVDDETLGLYEVVYSATDEAGNSNTVSRFVNVVDTTAPSFDFALENVDLPTDPGFCSALLQFAVTATDICDAAPSISYRILPNDFYPDGVDGIQPVYRFPPIPDGQGGWLPHEVEYTATDASGNSSSGAFFVTVTDEFQNCVVNYSWATSLPLQLEPTEEGSKVKVGEVRQFLASLDQSRWYRFQVQPGSRVTVVLSELPANFDVVLYRDIDAEYQRLLNLFNSDDPEEQELSLLLGAEFAPEAFSPEAFSPEAFSPEAFSPEAFSPEAFSPEAFSPEAFSPEAFSPEAFSPEAFSPEAFSPEAFSPEAFSPEAFSPEAFSPEAFSPEAFSPEAFSPEAFSPEAFSSAQVSSMIGYSAFPGTANEGIAINTFQATGDFYVRVRGYNGASSVLSPFLLSVAIKVELCEDVAGPESLGESTLPEPPVGEFDTLILWDSLRMEGADAAFEPKLDELAGAPGVNGAVVDVADELRVVKANAQADANPACVYAKNLVAHEIKAIVDAWRDAHPELKYIVLVGNDDVIPFFRYADEAFLAKESRYVPPVKDSTHSQSALRTDQVLTQDPYGAGCDLNLITGPYPYPKLPVGRLVESVEDISSLIDNYIASGGVIHPQSAMVSGYDFLDDVARAVLTEFEAAINGPADALIADANLSPEEGWDANALASLLLGQRHDLAFLAGHFSHGSLLAADWKTRLTAAQVLASSADLSDMLIFSAGCHSGASIVDAHSIPGVTREPDWPQAFAKKGATFVAGTGYQYGDTLLIEYSERLYLEFARQLRAGDGPVPVGQALVAAKQRYLAETPLMRGIHEKSLLQATLYGLPMLGVDVPGAPLAASSQAIDLEVSPSLAPPLSPEVAGPGNALGLQTADVTVNPILTPFELELDVINSDGSIGETVSAQAYSGRSGIVTLPVEPVRALESYDVSADNTLLRGVGFRGGSYEDFYNIVPLTGAPTTEIRGVYNNPILEVFYPAQNYSLSYLGVVCGGQGGELLNVYPTQYQSNANGQLGGTVRKYASMDFRLYYNNNLDVFTNSYNGESYEIIPALAPPPAISQVRSSLNLAGDGVDFEVNVVGHPAAGIHEVWVTHTRIDAARATGQWASLDLVQSSEDSTLWTGTLPLNGASSEEIVFMAQAVSGTGLVTLSKNRGFGYSVGNNELGGRLPTSISFVGDVPQSARYGESIPVTVQLTDGDGAVLPDRRVGVRVGTSRALGRTDGEGLATVIVALKTRPGEALSLQAYFQGDIEYAASSASVKIDLLKQDTFLEFVDPPLPGEPATGADCIARLFDGLGTPLKERAVVFVVRYPDVSMSDTVVTDFAGRADLSQVLLPAGEAIVSAYFNDIALPDGDRILIPDDLYNAASPVSIPVTLVEPIDEESLGFTPRQVDVYYKSNGSKGKNADAPIYKNASIAGDVGFNLSAQPSDLLANDPDPNYIEARVEATLAGTVIASETVFLDTRDGDHWSTASQPNNEVAYLGVHWSDAPSFDSALSGSPGPRIYTTFIGNSFTEFRYEPTPGTYATQFPEGGPRIAVKNGQVDVGASQGLLEKSCGLDDDGITFDAKFGLEPGMVFTTTGSKPNEPSIVVTAVEGLNYLREAGRMIVRLQALAGTPRPASDELPNQLECRVILGDEGENRIQVRSLIRIGDGLEFDAWTSEDPGHKQYRP